MEVEKGFQPNCSEAVFRFYTEDPVVAHKILSAFAAEVNSFYDGERVSENRQDGADKWLDKVAEASNVPKFEKMEDIGNVSFLCCAGLGDNNTVCTWEPDKKAFVLNMGNNDISPSGQGVAMVKNLGVKVEEAEYSPELIDKYARDCTCGITFFDDYEGLLRGK